MCIGGATGGHPEESPRRQRALFGATMLLVVHVTVVPSGWVIVVVVDIFPNSVIRSTAKACWCSARRVEARTRTEHAQDARTEHVPVRYL